jgi:hypothetical protein
MAFLKHIGKHGDRKVAIVFRTIPSEDHMALVLYPETLPITMHDDIMKVIESQEAQESTNLADVLSRRLLSNGQPILESIHKSGKLKKVQTKQVIVTPNASSHVRLDELNKILGKIETGDEAREKLEKIDNNTGMVDPTAKNVSASILDNSTLAKQQLDQSSKMELESKSLLTESKRLKSEAFKLDPTLKPKRRSTAKNKKVATKKASKKSTVA